MRRELERESRKFMVELALTILLFGGIFVVLFKAVTAEGNTRSAWEIAHACPHGLLREEVEVVVEKGETFNDITLEMYEYLGISEMTEYSLDYYRNIVANNNQNVFDGKSVNYIQAGDYLSFPFYVDK